MAGVNNTTTTPQPQHPRELQLPDQQQQPPGLEQEQEQQNQDQHHQHGQTTANATNAATAASAATIISDGTTTTTTSTNANATNTTTTPLLQQEYNHHHQHQQHPDDEEDDVEDMGGGDFVADMSVGLETKFLLLRPIPRPTGVPAAAAAAGPRMLPVMAPAAADDERSAQRHAYASVARSIERYGTCSQRAITIHEIQDEGRQEREYWPTHWIVKKANSALPRTKEELRHPVGSLVPVELSSPRLRWLDYSSSTTAAATTPTTTNGGSSEPLPPSPARDVLAGLRRAHQISVNYTCDVHVHIGRLDGAAFALPSLKKLATLLWLTEPTLRSIRDPNSENFTNKFTWGAEVRRYSRLATRIQQQQQQGATATADEPDDESDDGGFQAYMRMGGHAHHHLLPPTPAALRAIWRATSTQELGKLLSGTEKQYRRLGFNFSAFGEEDERAARAPKTVEFRILEGTLKEHMIMGWLHICCKLVETAMAERQDQFRDTVCYLLTAHHRNHHHHHHHHHQQQHYQQATSRYQTAELDAAASPPLPLPESPDRAFGHLMDRLGVDAAIYLPFQMKIRQDHGLGTGEPI